MKKLVYRASDFTPTEFTTADEKARFANHFIRFIESGCKWTLFHIWFYRKLSNCFGMHAHYDRRNFHAVCFEKYGGKNYNLSSFIDDCLEYPCYGDPSYTFCDVEKKLKEYLTNYKKSV